MSAGLELAGRVFGDLTVLRRAENSGQKRTWLCVCSCGRERVTDSGQLNSGSATSCGCKRRYAGGRFGPDMTGWKVGRLTLIRRERNHRGDMSWLSVCDCGKEIIRHGHEIRKSGDKASCGCLRAEESGARLRTRSPLESAKAMHLRVYKKAASDRDLQWGLSDEEFFALSSRDCHFCGAKPREIAPHSRKGRGDYFANGIDRLDNELGYSVANAVPCCTSCNLGKRTQGAEEFVDRCAAVAVKHGAGLTTPTHWFKRGSRFAQRAA